MAAEHNSEFSTRNTREEIVEEKPKKTRWVIFLIVTVVFCLALVGQKLWDARKINNLLLHTEVLKTRLSALDKLEEKKNRVANMEQTLMIQYKISWYEAHYYSIIMDDFAQKYEIPWQVYAAMVRIESNFDPTRISNKGARGMTQVMARTGEDIAKRLGIEWKKDGSTLWSEIPNMVIGFTYLSEAIKDKGLEGGFSTYLGGPGFDKGSKLVGDYRTTVQWEFERLRYIHEGVKAGVTPVDSILIMAEAK